MALKAGLQSIWIPHRAPIDRSPVMLTSKVSGRVWPKPGALRAACGWGAAAV